MSPFTDVSYKQFINAAETYMNNTLGEGIETGSAENGFKALALLYYGHSDNWSDDEINAGVILIRHAAKRWNDIEKNNE